MEVKPNQLKAAMAAADSGGAVPASIRNADDTKTDSQPYMLESDEFREEIDKRRRAALTIRENLETEVNRLEVEIRQRHARMADLTSVINAAEAALQTLPTTIPSVEPKEVI